MQSTSEFPKIQDLVIRISQSQIVLGVILMMFFADSVNSLLIGIGASFFRISIFVRAIALLYFLWLTFRFQRNVGRKLFVFVGSFYVFFVIGSLASKDLFNDHYFIENFSLINKLLFFFICFITFDIYFKSDQEQRKLFKVFEFIIFIEVVSILVGFIFHIDLLSSYGNRRFGYKGLIPAQNEVSGFLLIAFFYYLAKVDYLGKDILKLIIVMIAGLLSGTKVALLLPLVLMMQMIFWLSRRKVRIIFLYLVIALLLLIGIIFYSWDYILMQLTPTINYYSYRLASGDYSPIIVGTSGRLLLVSEFLSQHLPDYNFLSVLFGGQDLSIFSTETDVVDVFARFGLLGLSFFYFQYIRLLIGNIRKVYIIRFLFAVTWLSVSAVAGHLVFSAINGGYLAILLLAFASLERNHLLAFKPQGWETSGIEDY